MVMGFIFVAVAGIIFATSTWKYVPLVGKQIILAGISTGLYAFSFKVKKLEKTKTILFYRQCSLWQYHQDRVLYLDR